MRNDAFTKNKLLEGVDIKVYWKFKGKIYSGILLDRVFVDSEALVDKEGFTGRWKDVKGYTWDIQGDDGHLYSIPEKELRLSNLDFAN